MNLNQYLSLLIPLMFLEVIFTFGWDQYLVGKVPSKKTWGQILTRLISAFVAYSITLYCVSRWWC